MIKVSIESNVNNRNYFLGIVKIQSIITLIFNYNLLKVVSARFLLVCFSSLKTSETRKNVFYFTSKTLFVFEKIKVRYSSS